MHSDSRKSSEVWVSIQSIVTKVKGGIERIVVPEKYQQRSHEILVEHFILHQGRDLDLGKRAGQQNLDGRRLRV